MVHDPFVTRVKELIPQHEPPPRLTMPPDQLGWGKAVALAMLVTGAAVVVSIGPAHALNRMFVSPIWPMYPAVAVGARLCGARAWWLAVAAASAAAMLFLGPAREQADYIVLIWSFTLVALATVPAAPGGWRGRRGWWRRRSGELLPQSLAQRSENVERAVVLERQRETHTLAVE